MLKSASLIVAAASCLCVVHEAHAQAPLSTAFTFRGELVDSGINTTGTYDIRFRLYDAANGGNQVGPTLCSDNVDIVRGRFALSLDFGSVFNGQQRYLEMEVRVDAGLDCSDASGLTLLSPRQLLSATPQATYAATAASAESADTAQTATDATTLGGNPPSFYLNAANLTGALPTGGLSGLYASPLTLNNPLNVFAGNGASLINLSATNISSGVLSAARMPSNWAAGGDLTGFYPNPTIGGGVVTRSKLSTDVQNSIGTLVPDWATTPYQVASTTATETQPRGVSIAGNFAFVVNTLSSSLQIYNISNPAAPVQVGRIANDSPPVTVVTSGTRAYVVNTFPTPGFTIFDVSNPALPVRLGAFQTVFDASAIAVSGSFAYLTVTGGDKMQVYNVSNPAAPTFVTELATGWYPVSIATSGNFAYFVNLREERLKIVDISNPASPFITGSINTGRFPGAVAVAGSYAYVVTQDSRTLEVYNISNVFAPSLVWSSSIGTGGYAVTISNDRLFVACVSAVRVYSISTPSAPVLLGTISQDSAIAVAATASAGFVINTSNNTLQAFTPGARLSFTAALSASSLNGTIGSGLTDLNATNITSGTLAATRLPPLDGAMLTTGTINAARLPSTAAQTDLNNAFSGTVNSFAGSVGIGTTSPTNALDVNGRLTVRGGVIQLGTTAVTGTTNLGLYSSLGPIRFVTNAAQFAWYTDGGASGGALGAGTTPRMTLSATGSLSVTGNVSVSGTLSKAGGSFKIDHPLDPQNKYLYHSFVESPDMMNIYNGVVTTDASGYATITMPDYFEALNGDFRYQLTVLDESENDIIFAKVYRRIGAEAPGQFTIKTSSPNIDVSWMVTGIRHDAWAQKNRIPNAVEKTGSEKGKLLHPDAFNQPAEKGINFSPAASED